MFWLLAAQGAVTAAQGLLQNRQQRAQNKAQNRANAAADLITATNTAQALSALSVQNAAVRTQAAEDINRAEVAAYAATGTASANAAAASVKGASVDAVVNDITRELAEARTTIEQNVEVEQYNLSNRIRETIAGGIASLRGQVDVNRGTQNPLLTGLFSAGGAYLSRAMQFGSLARTATTPDNPVVINGPAAVSFGVGQDTATGLIKTST